MRQIRGDERVRARGLEERRREGPERVEERGPLPRLVGPPRLAGPAPPAGYAYVRSSLK